MGDVSAAAVSRRSKRLRTRAKLIDAAVDLVADRGYENTTVEQIAEAVEMSPRTVAYHFPSKSSLLMALVEEFSAAIETALTGIPAEVPPLQALCDAHLRTLELIAAGDIDVDLARVALLYHVANTSARLQVQALAWHMDVTAERLAARLGTGADDRQVVLLAGLWAGQIRWAWADLGVEPGAAAISTAHLVDLMADRLIRAYEQMMRICADEG